MIDVEIVDMYDCDTDVVENVEIHMLIDSIIANITAIPTYNAGNVNFMQLTEFATNCYKLHEVKAN